jgi:hypothetical protein
MENFNEQEKARIYKVYDVLQASLESHYNLNPQIDEAERKRTICFLQNAIQTEIDFLCNDPETYKAIYYEESEEGAVE